MPPRYSTAEVERALSRLGFALKHQRGSHLRYQAFWRGSVRNVTLTANQRMIPPGTLGASLRQAGITMEELGRLVAGEQIAE